MASNSQLKIIFIGTPEFGAMVLEKLIKSGHKPFLVITAQDKPVGRKQIVTPPPVKILAEKYNIPVAQPEKIGDWKTQIENLKPDLAIVASFGQMIPSDVLGIPRYGFVNVHPSLLPQYRGPSPIQYAILNGDEKTGVSIMRPTEKMDAGPVFIQRELTVNPNEEFSSLHDRLAVMGADLLIEMLPKLFAGQINAQSQDDSKATYSKIIKKEDGLIDWQEPAEKIERRIRAFNPWPNAYTLFNNKRLEILKAETVGGELIIKEVQLEGKKPMSFKDFLLGHPDAKELGKNKN